MSQNIVLTPEVVQAIAQAVATATAQALSAYAVTPAPASAESTPAVESVQEINARNEKTRTANARKRQSARKSTRKASEPTAQDTPNADGYVTGLVAAEGVSYKLVDKVANVRKQCTHTSCRKHRKGRSRFCAAHSKANFQAMIARKSK